jgi:hypothetical protein
MSLTSAYDNVKGTLRAQVRGTRHLKRKLVHVMDSIRPR